MKKLFQIIGILSLMGISFFYTEKIVDVVKYYDDIMIEIKNNSNKYKKESENAIIKDDIIIPGISGIEVDVNKSYSKMKRYGKYNESLIVLKKKKPKISIHNNNDNKYITSGNKKIKNISLIFLYNNNYVNEIVNILDKKKIKGNFFVSTNWLEKNTNIVLFLIKEKHIVGLLNYDKDYEWSRNVIKKIGKQKNEYCYTKHKNKNILNICKGYTFIPINISKNAYDNTKYNLRNGNIIAYEVNKQLVEELPIIINYIKNRGYNIVTLSKLIEE